MAGHSQPNLAAEDRNNERAPLLHRTDKHQTDAATEPRRDDGGDDDDAAGAANDGDLGQLNGVATSLRHRRWISLITSIILIAAFVVILILSGGTCLGILMVLPVSIKREIHVMTLAGDILARFPDPVLHPSSYFCVSWPIIIFVYSHSAEYQHYIVYFHKFPLTLSTRVHVFYNQLIHNLPDSLSIFPPYTLAMVMSYQLEAATY